MSHKPTAPPADARFICPKCGTPGNCDGPGEQDSGCCHCPKCDHEWNWDTQIKTEVDALGIANEHIESLEADNKRLKNDYATISDNWADYTKKANEQMDRYEAENKRLTDRVVIAETCADGLHAENKRLREALEWYAARGPVWSVHSKSMEPTLSSNEAKRAQAALKATDGGSNG